MATKHEVLAAHLESWLEARKDRKQRKKIIDLICSSIRIHSKSVPRAFKRLQLRGVDPAKRPGRPRTYGKDIDAPLFDLWEIADRPCGELLFPMVEEYVAVLKRDDEWKHPEETTKNLLKMSEHTMKRRVLAFMKKHGGHGYGKSTTSAGILKPTIPIFKGPWKDVLPGNGQIDTVAHCGNTLGGDYVFTVNYTDAATYWIIPRAQWNKGQAATLASLKNIRTMLPFPMKGLHPDSGSEFVNWVAKGWCDQEKIDLSRSEPGRKNDNMYVEERNGHVVRRYLGYVRYDCEDTVIVINELYHILALYLNHFKAVRRCIAKERVGAKYVRKYETKGQTSYQRVLEHSNISEENKESLRTEHASLNPLYLKKKIDTLIQKVYKIQQAARTEVVENKESR